MRKFLLLAFMIATGSLFLSCEKTGTSNRTRMMGEWKVVGTESFINEDGMVIEWGFFYVGSVGIKPDKTFTINGPNLKVGTWELKNNQHTIVFNSAIENMLTNGVTERRVDEFDISFDDKGRLILTDKTRNTYYIHKKVQ